MVKEIQVLKNMLQELVKIRKELETMNDDKFKELHKELREIKVRLHEVSK